MKSFIAIALLGVASAVNLSEEGRGQGGRGEGCGGRGGRGGRGDGEECMIGDGSDFIGDIADGLVVSGIMDRATADALEGEFDAEKVMEKFAMYDTDQDGELTVEEGAAGLVGDLAWDFLVDEETQQAVMDGIVHHVGHYDTDGSQTLDIYEVMGDDGEDDSFFGSIMEGLWDHGLISAEEYEGSEEAWGHLFDEESFDWADTTEDGLLDLEEGVAAFRYFVSEYLNDDAAAFIEAASDGAIAQELAAYLGHMDENSDWMLSKEEVGIFADEEEGDEEYGSDDEGDYGYDDEESDGDDYDEEEAETDGDDEEGDEEDFDYGDYDDEDAEDIDLAQYSTDVYKIRVR